MKVAVIGGGAAATGVVAGLSRWGPPDLEISLFDIGKTLGDPPAGLERGFDDGSLRSIYGRLRRGRRFAFPPPKSHFGEVLPKYSVGGGEHLWRSEHHGGLTTIWGGGMFPFTDRELGAWPITAEDLDPYYRELAGRVGVAGARDRLNDYFEPDYVNRPPMRTSPVMHKLIDTVNAGRTPAGASHDLIAGHIRLALETRTDRDNCCTYLGECMLGCPRNAVWSAGREIDQLLAAKVIQHHIRARVSRFVGDRVQLDGGDRLGPFDRIFVAAGCIGSTELVMRSLGIESGPRMLDNAVASFPILYTGAQARDPEGGYFSLCNATIGGIPRDPTDEFAQVSLYPTFDHLWRFYTPAPLWKTLSGLWRVGRWRLLLGRVFLAGRSNRTFSFHLRGGDLEVEPDDPPPFAEALDSFMDSLRATTNHNGFYVPKIPFAGRATSSHYAGTFPYGGDVVPTRTGRISPGVYLADASSWPSSPSISPTFTIMANAARTAAEALAESP